MKEIEVDNEEEANGKGTGKGQDQDASSELPGVSKPDTAKSIQRLISKLENETELIKLHVKHYHMPLSFSIQKKNRPTRSAVIRIREVWQNVSQVRGLRSLTT